MTRVKGIFISLLLCCLFLAPSICSAYSLTEEQATSIDNYLTKLEQNNNALEQSWNQSSKDLQTVNVKLGKVENSLTKVDTTLATVDQRLTKLENGLNRAIIYSEKTESLYKALEISYKKQEEQANRLKRENFVWKLIAIYLATR